MVWICRMLWLSSTRTIKVPGQTRIFILLTPNFVSFYWAVPFLARDFVAAALPNSQSHHLEKANAGQFCRPVVRRTPPRGTPSERKHQAKSRPGWRSVSEYHGSSNYPLRDICYEIRTNFDALMVLSVTFVPSLSAR